MLLPALQVPFIKINLSSTNKERTEKNTVHGANVKEVCFIIDRQGKNKLDKRAIIIDIVVVAFQFNSLPMFINMDIFYVPSFL